MLVKVSNTEYSYKGHQVLLHKAELGQNSTRGGCGWYATVDGQICEQSRGCGNRKLAVVFAQAMIDESN